MLMSCASAGTARVPAAIRVRKNKTLRGEAASLTKGSVDARAGTPSRLQDDRTRFSTAPEAEVEVALAARCGKRGGPGADRARPAVPPYPRPAGAALLPTVAPSRRDFGPRTRAEGIVTAAVVAA